MMQMLKFGELFGDLAARQMVMLWIDPPRKRLPVTAYGLLEYYCADPACDCRRVMLNVLSSDLQGRVFASIHFGWESVGFYRKWGDLRNARLLTKGVLDPSDFNCDWADVLLDHVRKNVLTNPKQVARFKRHYEMLKREHRKRARNARQKGQTALKPGAEHKGGS